MPKPSMLPVPNQFQYAPPSFIGTYQHLFVCHLLCPTDFQHPPPRDTSTFQMLPTVFYSNVTTLRSGICYRKYVCLSSVLSVTFVHRLTQCTFVHTKLKLSAIFLCHCVPYSQLLTSVQNFTENVPGKLLRRGR